MTMLYSTATVRSSSTDYSSVQVEREDGNNLDKDAFFKLLITQLKYQDPLTPMDNTEFIAQMAQFSSLEQMANMNANLSQFLRIQALSEGASLIGRNVETVDADTGEIIRGEVVRVSFEEGSMYAYLDNDRKIDIEGITAVY
ncbi:MAG: flagellar hook assembly protein FlgD [Halanaerobiales bacterium]|jgi:flagellar basal-body rod modification protein FlgD|nr:flagellar hook assembly protein FlgD [Halanaerobiales bacterium]HPZ63062.1 flagellar hook assembly protein FlgD [Halanaerobiales bacterium]HQD04012.1 flagellar hook assembly protein FlgD [Halanaerobiales bacterium]